MATQHMQITFLVLVIAFVAGTLTTELSSGQPVADPNKIRTRFLFPVSGPTEQRQMMGDNSMSPQSSVTSDFLQNQSSPRKYDENLEDEEKLSPNEKMLPMFDSQTDDKRFTEFVGKRNPLISARIMNEKAMHAGNPVALSLAVHKAWNQNKHHTSELRQNNKALLERLMSYAYKIYRPGTDPKRQYEFVGKRQVDSENAKRYEFLGKRNLEEQRLGAVKYLGSILGNIEGDKRYDFLGKRVLAKLAGNENGYGSYEFLGKRASDIGADKRYDFLGKRHFDDQIVSEGDTQKRYDFLGKRELGDSADKRYEFLGKRYDFIGKRPFGPFASGEYNPSQEKRYDFLGKRGSANDEGLGDNEDQKRYDFLGKRSGQSGDSKEENKRYDFLGKKSVNANVKRFYDFLGKRGGDLGTWREAEGPKEEGASKQGFQLAGQESVINGKGKRYSEWLGKRKRTVESGTVPLSVRQRLAAILRNPAIRKRLILRHHQFVEPFIPEFIGK